MDPRLLRSLDYAVSVEPATAAGSPQEVLSLSVLQWESAAATLVSHLQLSPGLLLLLEGKLQRFVN